MTTPIAAGPLDRRVRARDEWVKYNPLTRTYDTKDGTSVSAELVDSACCLLDFLHIADVRSKQRAAMRSNVQAQGRCAALSRSVPWSAVLGQNAVSPAPTFRVSMSLQNFIRKLDDSWLIEILGQTESRYL